MTRIVLRKGETLARVEYEGIGVWGVSRFPKVIGRTTLSQTQYSSTV